MESRVKLLYLNHEFHLQELFELAQRKLLRQLALYAENQDTDVYPRLFVADFLKDESKEPAGETMRIYHEYDCRIDKSVPRITVWHHEVCRVTTNGDCEGL